MFYLNNRIALYIWVVLLITGAGACGVAKKNSNKPDALTLSQTGSNSRVNPLKESKTNVGIFVQIPAGAFDMGSNNRSYDSKPVHNVRITKPFEIGKYEVTQEQWQAVMGSNPSNFKGEANLPVEQVSWEDVQKFTRKLNVKKDGYIYRLPTEAEWEYACRAGSTGDYKGDLDTIAWYSSNSGSKTHPVGQKKANGWGLYDMLGNVWEWCSDWYLDAYYQQPLSDDPTGPSSGSLRVYRGGCWLYTAGYLQPAFRFGSEPTYRIFNLGFRLVRT